MKLRQERQGQIKTSRDIREQGRDNERVMKKNAQTSEDKIRQTGTRTDTKYEKELKPNSLQSWIWDFKGNPDMYLTLGLMLILTP